LPGRASVGGFQDYGVVPDGEAGLLVHERQRSQRTARRHIGLSPGATRVIGIHHHATLARRDHPLSRARDIEKYHFRGQRRLDRRLRFDRSRDGEIKNQKRQQHAGE
jgi:hypothetical protein